jgi:hypothetical protein
MVSNPTRQRVDNLGPVEDNPYSRTNWKNRSSSLWPYTSTRLDLAWSCENGAYGSPAAPVVSIEAAPLQSHADINSSRVGSYHLSVSSPGGLQALSAGTMDYFLAHALAVAGVAVATGNNAIGTPGVVWQGRGVVMSRSIQSGGSWYPGDDYALELLLSHLQSLTPTPRVLNLSSYNVVMLAAPPAYKQLQQQAYTRIYKDFLDKVPGLSIVMSSGNDSSTSLSSFASGSQTFPAEQLALFGLRSTPAYSDRIVVATAANSSGTRPVFANDFSGTTDVAAPGEGIRILRYSSSPFPQTVSGTSFAAPFVAGVLALAYTMDPSLSPAQAKLALTKGAATRKGRDANGNVIASSIISGGSVRLLDAYSTLSLVSSRKVGLPVCGAQVGWDYGGTSVLFKYNADSVQRAGPAIPTASELSATGLSVAPGGRKIALSGWENVNWQHAHWTAELINGAWSVSSASLGTWKHYLYEDTAVVAMSNYFSPRVSIQNDSVNRRVSNLDLTGKGADTSIVLDYGVSPTGDWILAEEAIWDPNCYAPENTRRLRFYALRTGITSKTVDSIRTCTGSDVRIGSM